MNGELLKKLGQLNEDEAAILKGIKPRSLSRYFCNSNIVDSKTQLEAGKTIDISTHTRFIAFPKHKHNYVEMVYMCSGKTVHIVNGVRVELKKGEILLMNQNATHEILPCGATDITVNFIILPEFFDRTLAMMGSSNNTLKDFLINCLCSAGSPTHYLYFKVADALAVQDLIEVLIWNLMNKVDDNHFMNQTTMGLIFLQLMKYENNIDYGKDCYSQEILMTVLKYIEEQYKTGSLLQLSKNLGCEFTWLSKEIKRLTGCSYIELIQNKRLDIACSFLKTTDMPVTDISLAVGYDNFSYFRRLFKSKYELSPKKYRLNINKNKGIE